MYNYNNYNNYNNYGYNSYYPSSAIGVQPYKLNRVQENGLLVKTYKWMSIALAISFLCSFVFSKTPLAYASNTMIACIVSFIAELILMKCIMKASINNPQKAKVFLMIFAAITGITLSGIFATISAAIINTAFLITCVDFGVMSFVGMHTRANLKPLAKQLYGALFALIAVGCLGLIIGFFVGGAKIALFFTVFSAIDAVVFSLITMVNTNKLVKLANAHLDNIQGIAIVGALQLFLDFINLFLDFVEILSRGNN